jgi:hypothetical protein
MAKKDRIPEPCSFDELVDEHTMRVFDALIRGGTREFKGDLRIAMDSAIQWRLECGKHEKQQKKLGKKKD